MTNANPDTEIRARRIIERLKMFNRKERDHLMKFALCEKPEAPKISPALRKIIGNSAKMPEPDEMFIGMDYHLNWLYAALATNEIEKDLSDKTFENEWKRDCECKRDGVGKGECKFKWPSKDDKKSRPIRRNQEDADLVVTWWDSDSKKLELVLVEAKLDSGWSSKQFKSKKERLRLIYQDANNRGLGFINWRFLLLSPGSAPTRNQFALEKIDDSCDWMLVEKTKDGKGTLWHEKLPIKTTLRRVKRKTKQGLKWTTIPSKPTIKKKDRSKR